MELYSDTYYIHRVLNGDTGCFACLFDRYNQSVFTLIVRIVQQREQAEELAQDVWLKAFDHLSAFNEECAFSTWLYRIAYNTAISATRHRKQELLPIDDAIINTVTEEDMASWIGYNSDEIQMKHLKEALDLLPPDDRALILLFYWQKKSVDELSVIFGLTSSNVKVRLHRIRKRLYVLLKEMEDK